MATADDRTIINGKEHRFSSLGFWQEFFPWGGMYTDTTLALAKAQVDLTNSVKNEHLIILYETVLDKIFVFIQKSTGYDSTFDLSFDLFWDSSETYVKESTLDALLATKDISTLSGMTSTSAQVETAISDTGDNNTVLGTGSIADWVTATVYAVGDVRKESGLIYICKVGHTSGVFATDLMSNDWALYSQDINDAISNQHTQNMDTGTDSPTFELNSGGFKAIFDTSNQTESVTIDCQRLANRLSGIGFNTDNYTKSQLASLGTDVGQQVFCTDIDTIGFPLTWDGTDWISSNYIFQDGSNTIATTPTVGLIYGAYLGKFWECLDATAGEEVFKATTQRLVEVQGANATLTTDQCQGQTHINSAAVTLTLPPAEAGLHVSFEKNNTGQLVVNAGVGDTIAGFATSYGNTAATVDISFRLICIDSTQWVLDGADVGAWTGV